jgi:hypothetical protein
MSNFRGIHVRATYFFDCSFKLNIIGSVLVILKYFELGEKEKGGGGEIKKKRFSVTISCYQYWSVLTIRW